MEKNTIGQFIAALRKAKGMTQQEVADRLNVSNKAVSRWEHDMCAPDLSLIPALAEMFDVSCDELLKGERLPPPVAPGKREAKVERQIRQLVTRTLSGFKALIWISLTVAIAGLVCMFGISYGFYRPVIGFAVMLLFEACALVIAILAVSRTRDVRTGNELFELAEGALVRKFDRTLGTLSFLAFFTIGASVLLSLPLILITSGYANSVLSLRSYFSFFFGGIALLLALVWLKCRRPCAARISGTPAPAAPVVGKPEKTMTAIQLGFLLLAGLLFLFAPWLLTSGEGFPLFEIAILLALLCFAGSGLCFAVQLVRNRAGRRALVLPGIRNLLMMLPLPLLQRAHEVSWWHAADGTYGREDTWHIEFIWFTAVAILAIYLVFAGIDTLRRRKTA